MSKYLYICKIVLTKCQVLFSLEVLKTIGILINRIKEMKQLKFLILPFITILCLCSCNKKEDRPVFDGSAKMLIGTTWEDKWTNEDNTGGKNYFIFQENTVSYYMTRFDETGEDYFNYHYSLSYTYDESTYVVNMDGNTTHFIGKINGTTMTVMDNILDETGKLTDDDLLVGYFSLIE